MFSRRRSRTRREAPTLTRHIAWGVLLCVLVTLLLSLVWYGTRLNTFTLAAIVVEGGDTIPHADIEAVVEGVLSGTYLSLIPRRFTFLYPHDSIAAALDALPRVEQSAVTREGRTLRVVFTEYRPYALWCLHDSETECAFLDEYGYAFSPGPRLEGGALVRFVIETETAISEKQLFSQEVFARMNAFLLRLRDEAQLRVTDVRITRDGDLILTLGGGGELKMRNDEAYDAVFANLATVRSSPEFSHLEPGNFWYIDLRFGNKIFVNEEIPMSDTGTSTASTTEDKEESVTEEN